MLNEPRFIYPALGEDAIKQQERTLGERSKPSSFLLRAQMLDQGRTDTVLAASEDLTIRLKVYASGGENELHAHTSEDHSFMILQGSAKFFGPNNEELELGKYQGIMLPKGAHYRFYATSQEPLVMLRVGAPGPKRQSKPYRIGADGKEMLGHSEENKTVPVVFRDNDFFGG